MDSWDLLIFNSGHLYIFLVYMQGGSKKMWIDWEEKFLRNLEMFLMESFSLNIHIYSKVRAFYSKSYGGL